MKTKNLAPQDVYNILGSSRDKIRAFFGISIDIFSIENGIITIRVEQKELINNYILNQSELVSRAGKLFSKLEGYKLRFKPLTYMPNYDIVNAEWIKKRMLEFKVKNNDIVKHTGIDRHEVSRLINNVRKLTKSQKALFYFYFMQYELNRDFREDGE